MTSPPKLPQLKVLLVEDSPLVRHHLTVLVERLPGLELAGTAETAAGAIAAVANSAPDIVILDVVLKEGSGLKVLRAIRQARSRCAVIVFTNEDTELHRRHCLAAGADWFLSKSRDHVRLEQLLRSCAERHGMRDAT